MSELQTKIDRTISILDSNIKIEDDVKANMLLLAIEFYKRFPQVPLENFYTRLESVEILGGSKYLYNAPIQYLPQDNEIIINKQMLTKEETDVDHSMMMVIISMITAKDNYYGFARNKSLEALNYGFCDMISKTLVGNEGISGYEQELEIVNFVGNRTGVNVFTEAFFTNNPDLLLKTMLDLCGDAKSLNEFLDQTNHNMYTRDYEAINDGLVPVALQKKMIKMFGNVNLNAMRQTINTTSLSDTGKSR